MSPTSVINIFHKVPSLSFPLCQTTRLTHQSICMSKAHPKTTVSVWLDHGSRRCLQCEPRPRNGFLSAPHNYSFYPGELLSEQDPQRLNRNQYKQRRSQTSHPLASNCAHVETPVFYNVHIWPLSPSPLTSQAHTFLLLHHFYSCYLFWKILQLVLS